MRRKRKPPVESFTLTAVIQSLERSYFIAEHHDQRRVDDEAILTVWGRIEQISPRYERHIGTVIEMQLLCARSFRRDEPLPATDKPFLMSVSLRDDNRSLAAYLPADAFWALPEMINSKAITHIQAEFEPSRAGYADLQFLHFASSRAIAESG